MIYDIGLLFMCVCMSVCVCVCACYDSMCVYECVCVYVCVCVLVMIVCVKYLQLYQHFDLILMCLLLHIKMNINIFVIAFSTFSYLKKNLDNNYNKKELFF